MTSSQRHLILFFLLPFFLGSGPSHGDTPEKAPYRLLFSNDTTNITSCSSPFNPDCKGFREEFLDAEIEESKAADVQILQPGLGWIPWWKSEVLPIEDHVRWLKGRRHHPDSYEKYMHEGGDLVGAFVEKCRHRGIPVFISLRMNDLHHAFRGLYEKDPVKKFERMSRFQWFSDHPGLFVGPGRWKAAEHEYAFDYARPEVRDYRMSLISELAKNYDLDGLELDFMRFWIYFHPDRTTSAERLEIMTDLLRKVRSLLDDSAKNGKRPRLCVRIPGAIKMYDEMGIDLQAWSEAGVDMFNLSSSYFTDFTMDLSEIVARLPSNKAFYPELHFVVSSRFTRLPPQAPGHPVGPYLYRRTTPHQYYTATHMAYSRGAAGVSLFNFHYYRCTRVNLTDVFGDPCEPPFEILPRLRNRSWLAEQPQHYAIGRIFHSPGFQGFIRQITMKDPKREFHLDMEPPKGGWKKGGKLRIQSEYSLAGTEWDLLFNGNKLEPTNDVSEPYENPYPTGLGRPEEYKAWIVPGTILKSGKNRIELILKKASRPQNVFYLDLSAE